MSMDIRPDSPEAQFWTDKHGGVAPQRDSGMDAVKEDARVSYNEARSRSEEEEDWNASRDVREELMSKYSDVKTGDLLQTFAQWHEAYKRDPVTAADHFARSYASRGPVVPKPRQKHDDTPPAGLDEIGKRNWHRDNDVRKALREAADHAADRSEFKASAKERALIKQAFPGMTFNEVMTSLAGVDEAMQSNPHLVARKLAHMYGAPSTEGEVVDRHQAAVYQQQAAGLAQWIGQVEQSGALPALDHPKVQSAVVNVLEHMNANGLRTGSIEHDLFAAYQHAIAGLQTELQAEQDKAAAEKAQRASRSISGSSSTDVVESDHRPGSGSSTFDAARAAYHSHAAQGSRI